MGALTFVVLPVPGDGHERCRDDEFYAALGGPDGELARRAIERHQPRGILRHGGHVWLTRFHCRWACSWIASVNRADPRVLMERVGLTVAR